MAKVTIAAARLQPADDPADGLVLEWTGTSGDMAPRGTVEMLATGDKRAVEWPGIDETLSVEVPLLPYTSLRRIERWQGRALVWRDLSGRLTWARLEGIRTTDDNFNDADVTSVSISLRPISGSPAV